MFKLSSNFREKLEGKQKKEKWQLFNATDFQSLMYPCFTFCRILGIFSYNINASTFKTSKQRYILSTVITCASGIYALITLFDFSLFGKTFNMFNLPGILVNSCNRMFGIFIIIVTFILSGSRMRLLQIILKISSRLPSESYRKLSRLIHTKDIIGSLYLLGHIFVLILKSDEPMVVQLEFLIQIYIYLVVFQMDMLYMNCVCVLRACFKRINDNLAYMKRVLANNEPHISRLNYHDQENHFLIMELKALKKHHLVINDTVQMLNTIFSLQLLATIVITFCDITGHLYYYILLRKRFFENYTLDNTLYHVYFSSKMVYDFTKIALVVWACETGNSQSLQISTSIYDVFNNTADQQIKNEVV
ncbi:PREDICTED: uncharacterized protein LOC105569150 [Vollenhovia emeryi]|uniref:uncharacterized protein LOC105569150 n=1 Tax=Vollenhovia emeryi TaxID=411798 RepID=UPI0005F40256|nr:PREDICTED: uncharacterized protein LOC105569150 [Vollenhovia emeryi]